MAEATVLGVSGKVVHIPIGSAENAALANQYLSLISQEIRQGTLTPYSFSAHGPLHPPAGPGVLFMDQGGFASIPAGTGTVVDTAPGRSVLLGGTAEQQVIISGTGGIQYMANTGAGTVIAGGGNNELRAAPGTGDHLFLTDSGNDVILALGGNDTISAGLGDNRIVLGSGNDSVQVTGRDTIFAGSGNETISIARGATALVYGGTGTLTFYGPGVASTVLGGQGAPTLFGAGGDAHGHPGNPPGHPDSDTGPAGHGTLTGGASGAEFHWPGLLHGHGENAGFAAGLPAVAGQNHAGGAGHAGSDSIAGVSGSATISLSDNARITFQHLDDLTKPPHA